jgi:outer membrane lipoprotein-sorting protein
MKPAIRTILALLVAAWIAPVLAQQPLPPGETILDKYIEVTGGKAAYEKIHSTVVTGTITFGAMGIKGTLTIYQAEPALMLTEINLEGVGKMLEGSDGIAAWSLSAVQGPRLKEGEEKAEAIREATMHSDTRWRDYFTKAETTGVENVDGKPCYKVVLTPKEGSPEERYFDKDTNLLVKGARKVKSPMGELAAEGFTADYRKEGEILIPHKVTQKVAGQEIQMTIDRVEYNVTIPKEKFTLPDEIKALIAKGK